MRKASACGEEPALGKAAGRDLGWGPRSAGQRPTGTRLAGTMRPASRSSRTGCLAAGSETGSSLFVSAFPHTERPS